MRSKQKQCARTGKVEQALANGVRHRKDRTRKIEDWTSTSVPCEDRARFRRKFGSADTGYVSFELG